MAFAQNDLTADVVDNDLLASTVVSFADADDLSRFGRVGKRWATFSRSNEPWEHVARAKYPVDMQYLSHSSAFSHIASWKERTRLWGTVQRRWQVNGTGSDKPAFAWSRPSQSPVYCTNAIGHRTFAHGGADGIIRIVRWEPPAFPTGGDMPGSLVSGRGEGWTSMSLSAGKGASSSSLSPSTATAAGAGSSYQRYLRSTRSSDAGHVVALSEWRAHEKGMLCLSADIAAQTLVSGDWDGMAKVWSLRRPRATDFGPWSTRDLRDECARRGIPTSDVPTDEAGRPALVYRLQEVLRPRGAGAVLLGRLEGHTGTLVAAAHAGDTCVTASHDGSVGVWDLGLGAAWSGTWAGGDGDEEEDAHSRTHTAGTSWRPRRVGAPWTRSPVRRLLGHSGPVDSVFYQPRHGRVLSGGKDGDVRVWDILSGQCVHTFEGPDCWVWAVKSGSNYLDSTCEEPGLKRGMAYRRGLVTPACQRDTPVPGRPRAVEPSLAAHASGASGSGGGAVEHWGLFSAQEGAHFSSPASALPASGADTRVSVPRGRSRRSAVTTGVDATGALAGSTRTRSASRKAREREGRELGRAAGGHREGGEGRQRVDQREEDSDHDSEFVPGDDALSEDFDEHVEGSLIPDLENEDKGEGERTQGEAEGGSRDDRGNAALRSSGLDEDFDVGDDDMYEDDDEDEEAADWQLNSRYYQRAKMEAAAGTRTRLSLTEEGWEEAGERPVRPYGEAGETESGACGVGCDGNLIVSTSTDGFIRMYDLRSRRAVGNTHIEPDAEPSDKAEIPVSGLALQLAHARFVTASFDGYVRVWDARMLRPMLRMAGRNCEAISLSRADVSSDTISTGGSDGSIQMWDMWNERTGAYGHRLSGNNV